MKSNKRQIIQFFILSLLVNTTLGQSTKVLTYNIKYDATSDTINNWNFRKEAMVKLIRHYDPVFLGVQEALVNQVEYLDSSLPSHRYIGVGRDDGKQKGEYSAIFYNSTAYKVIRSGTFWLSETPDRVSKGWDAALERICTYGLFENVATQQRIWVFNTHFDHIGEIARTNSAQLIVDRIKEVDTGDIPIVLMGDFNLTPDTEGISILRNYLQDGQKITEKPFYGPEGTFNGFDPDMDLDQRIDYVFVKHMDVTEYIHIDDRMDNNKHISDHLPVLVGVE